MKILIWEDEVLIALALKDLVIDLGHEVVGRARTSSDARAVAEIGRPDLALVDLGLADRWKGPDLINDFTAAGIDCIVISGQTEDLGPMPRVLPLLPKPVNEKMLADLLTARSLS